jgi:hypothetical protein
VHGQNILDAVNAVRDRIAYAETNDIPMCVLSLDFQNAFDNISHDYLFSILHSYEFSTQFITLLKSLYKDVTSTVQINGELLGHIPICCGIRQGCPLSMTLFTLCLQQFLNLLELPGIHDVTLIVTSRNDIHLITNAIRTFEKASGVRINLRKSKALSIGRWETNTKILNIPFQPTIKILGLCFSDTIRKSIHATWTTITGKVTAKEKEAFMRDLCLAHRIAFTHIYIYEVC